jgi:hypothetical protein
LPCCKYPLGALKAFARRLLPVPVLPILVDVPAPAKVVAGGKPTAARLYWQKVEKNSGALSYLHRSKSNSKILKGDSCDKRGIKKP